MFGNQELKNNNQKESFNFGDLPNEVLYKIIDYIDYESYKKIQGMTYEFEDSENLIRLQSLFEAKIEEYVKKLKNNQEGDSSFWTSLGLERYLKKLQDKNEKPEFDFEKFSIYLSNTTDLNKHGYGDKLNYFYYLSQVFNKDILDLFYYAHLRDFEELYRILINDMRPLPANLQKQLEDKFLNVEISNFKPDNFKYAHIVLAFNLQIKKAIKENDLQKLKDLVATGFPCNFSRLSMEATDEVKNYLENVGDFLTTPERTNEILDNTSEEELKYYLSARTAYGNNVLHQMYNKECELISKIVKAGIDINSKSLGGSTALHYACNMTNLEAVKNLIALGADVNSVDRFRRTPLYCVTSRDEKDTLEIVKELLKQPNINVNIRNNKGETPIDSLASWALYKTYVVAEELLKKEDIEVSEDTLTNCWSGKTKEMLQPIYEKQKEFRREYNEKLAKEVASYRRF